MAERQVFVGSVGPFLYQDDQFYAIDTDGKARVGEPPTGPDEVARYQDVMLIDGDQTVGGNKVFTGNVRFDGLVGFFGTTPTGASLGWSVTNVTPTKVYDADTVALAQLADTVGTLINYLKALGILGA